MLSAFPPHIYSYIPPPFHTYLHYIFTSRVLARECTQAHACLHVMCVLFTLSHMQIVAFKHTHTCMPACICCAGPRLYLCGVIIFHPLAVHALPHQVLCSGAAPCRPLSPPVHAFLHQALCSFATLCRAFPPPLHTFLRQALCVCKI